MIYTLSISELGHDSSVTLLQDDEIVFFITSERVSRIKHDRILFNEALSNISKITNNIDLMLTNYNSESIKKTRKLKEFLSLKGCTVKRVIELSRENNTDHDPFNKQNPEKYTHHDYHALSAFYMSPFDEAVCLIIDGVGNTQNLISSDGRGMTLSETTSIIEISNSYDLKVLYKKFFSFPIRRQNLLFFPCTYGGVPSESLRNIFKLSNLNCTVEISNHFDIGQIYDAVSNVLSFGISHGAGKTMGLSAYGKLNNNMPEVLIPNTTIIDNNLFKLNREIDTIVYPKFNENLSDQDRADFAYNVQDALQKIFLSRAEFIKNNSKSRNLVICGGCALNILGVSLIKEKYPEFNIFVDPIATDATQSIGVAIHAYNHLFPNVVKKKKNKFNTIYLGERYSLEEMKEKIDSRF